MTQKQWYQLAIKAGKTLYAHQEKTFKGDTMLFYSQEVTRYDDFVAVRTYVSARSWQHGEAEAINEAVGTCSATINLNDWTEDEDLDKFVAETMEQITEYRQKVDEFRKTYQHQ